MYKSILIATDGSEVGQKAVVQGLSLAKALNARVTAVNVTSMWSAFDMAKGHHALERIAEFEQAAAAHAGKVLDTIKKSATDAGVECQTIHVPDRTPAEGILDAARSHHCDLIVMGSHGRRGLNRLLLGSQALEVMTLSKIPVMICR